MFYTEDFRFGGEEGKHGGVKENNVNRTVQTKNPMYAYENYE